MDCNSETISQIQVYFPFLIICQVFVRVMNMAVISIILPSSALLSVVNCSLHASVFTTLKIILDAQGYPGYSGLLLKAKTRQGILLLWYHFKWHLKLS